MNFNNLHRNGIVLALAGLVLFLGAVAFVASKHIWASDRLAEVEPRYARLIGIEASAGALDTAIAERRALLERHAYPASQDVARAGSDAQQRAREIFTKAGMEVSSTQILAAKPVEGFDRIPVTLRMDGDMVALQSALVVLPGQAPSLFFEGFNVQNNSTPRAEAPQRLSVQVNLFVLMVRK
ncbi:MAG: type II secretion system protein GspM [Ramlibacter sp.]